MGKPQRQTSLTVKQIVLTFLVVLVVGGGVTLAQSLYSLGVERAAAEARIQQLVDSARENAAAATFRLDEDLADYVATGLAFAPEIAEASIRDENGDLLASQQRAEQAKAPRWLQDLAYGDLADIEVPLYARERADLLVGMLVVQPDRQALANSFMAFLGTLVFLDAAKAVLLALALSALFFFALTRPLLRLVESVKQLSPGADVELSNVASLRSKRNEMGRLVGSFDKQLLLFKQLLQERSALLNELQLRDAALDAMDSGLLLIDASNKNLPVIDENAAIAEMLEQPVASMQGRSVSDVFNNLALSSNEAPRAADFIVAAMTGPGTSTIYEFETTKNETRLYTISIVPVYTGADDVAYRAIIVSDITQVRETEDKLRHAQKMDALGKVAGGIAHDFNNTLAVMKGNLELAGMDFREDPAVQTYLQPIERSVDRAAELTRRLLRFSRKEPLQSSRESVDEVITQLEDMLARSLTPQIDITLELDAADAEVKIDRGDFEDALLNLAVNARDAMPEGGTLCLQTHVETLAAEAEILRDGMPPGRYVCLKVTDTGIGIESAILKRLFEPFFTTKDASVGTGLGLSQVYGFVERSAGNVKVSSTPGGGSAFTIYLPLHGADSPALESARTPQVLERGEETILLVDDEEDLLETARVMLERLGYSVHVAANAMDAVSLFEKHRDGIDLLMSDIVMPGGMDGYELADKLRQTHPDLPILLTSGYDSKRGNRSTYRVLAKPYSAEELAKTVRQILQTALREHAVKGTRRNQVV